MVVKRIIILLIVVGSSVNVFASGYHSVARYRITLTHREQIESGIEQWLKQNPEYHNYDEWKRKIVSHCRRINKCDTVPLIESIAELKENNYCIDRIGYKHYVVYDPQSSIYYPIMVLNWMGFYIAGLDVCVMNICFSDGRGAGTGDLSKREIKEALKNFKKNIFPQIVDYVRKEQKKK